MSNQHLFYLAIPITLSSYPGTDKEKAAEELAAWFTSGSLEFQQFTLQIGGRGITIRDIGQREVRAVAMPIVISDDVLIQALIDYLNRHNGTEPMTTNEFIERRMNA